MNANENKKCGFTLFFAVFGAVLAVLSIAALIVKFFVLKDVQYGSCYQCDCGDDFDEDEDDDFVNEEDEEDEKN